MGHRLSPPTPRYGLALVVISFACQSSSSLVDKGVDDGRYPDWDSGGGSSDTPNPIDTSTPLDETEWAPLIEEWRDCQGTLRLDESAFVWTQADDGCTITGSALLANEQLTLQVEAHVDCEPPWWLHETDPIVHGYEVVGERLTLVPLEPLASNSAEQTTSKQFAKGAVDRQRWEMESSEGDRSTLDICFLPEGPFYSGRYRADEDSCNFLSCGGVATGALITEESFTVYTACAGSCPCVGMLFADTVDENENELAGAWSGANCARTMYGEFSATRALFPEEDR